MFVVRRQQILADAHLRGGFGPLSRARPGPTLASGSPCPCVKNAGVAEILRRINMPRAAEMHLFGTAKEWGPEDWGPHAKEEDHELFRRLRGIAVTLPDEREHRELLEEVADLQREHDEVVYPAVARGEVPPAEMMKRHGAREDALILRWGDRLLRDAGVSAEVRTGIDILMSAPTGEDDPAYLAVKDVTHMSYADYLRAKKAAAAEPAAEYFADPIQGLPTYLSGVPANPTARVAAMRARVSEYAKTTEPGVAPMADASYLSLRDAATSIYKGYQAVERRATDPEAAEKFAKEIGKPLSSLVGHAPDVVKSLSGDAIKNLVPEVWKQIGPDVMRKLREVAESAVGTVGDVSGAIPVFGQWIKFIVDAFMAYDQAKNEDFQKQCAELIENEVVTPAKRTGRLGLPIPWHALKWSLNCRQHSLGSGVERWTATPDQEKVSYAMRTNLRRWEELPDISLNAETMRWWTLALQLMSTEQVKPIFNALGDDPKGGLSASDEQVMLVAAPIAVANGFDVDAFARALYERSNGWHDPSVAAMLKPEPYEIITGEHCVSHCSSWDPLPSTYEPEGYMAGLTEPANAMQVQFGVLARDAFALAEEWKAKAATEGFALRAGLGLMLADQPKSTTQKLKEATVPTLIGLASGGILLVTGATLLTAAVPVGLAFLWLAMTGSRRDTSLAGKHEREIAQATFTFDSPPVPAAAPAEASSVFTVVSGPNPSLEAIPVSRLVTMPPPSGLTLKTAPRTAPTSAATVTEHGSEPPEWFTKATDAVDGSMNDVVNETARHPYGRFAEDVFYLDRMVEWLRTWERELLKRADAVRSEKKFS